MARWVDRWRRQGPALPPDERRRRRRELVIIVVTAVALVVFAVLDARLPEMRSSAGLAGNIIYFLLVNLNLVLLVLLVFLLTRNLMKLTLERRRGIFGSRLRTRLVLAFTGLTLVPATLLFFVSETVLTAAFDTWFNVRVESSLEGSLDVAENYYQFAASNAQHFADEVARQVQDRGMLGAGQRTSLQRFVEGKRVEFALAGVQVFGPDGKSLARSTSAELARASSVQSPDLLSELLEGEDAASTIPYGRTDLIRVGSPIHGAQGAVLGAVAVDYLVPRRVSQTARDLARAYHEYRTLASMKQPIKNGYILTLALVTLAVVFLATWFGLRQARAITVPLRRLAEGTREIAQGNWDHRIEPGSDADVAVLVDSFNQMTCSLQQMNAEVVERRTELESILENIAAGVVSLDTAGRVAMVNRAAERMLGLRLAAIRGVGWMDAFERPDLRAVAAAVHEELASPDDEVQRQVKLLGGEHIVTALITVTALRDEGGLRRGTMLFLEDVTHLQRVQRMEAWREVARRLAHEIKNPLTPIQLSAQRLRKRYGELLGETDGGVFDECTRTIVGQVDELKRMVNEFSMFARLPALELVPNDLNEVVEEALVLYREAHPEICFDVRLAPELPPIGLDREAIKRAIINILDNAVTASQDAPGGGRIEITTASLPVPGLVRLELADNGPGLSGDAKMRLFEPYFSTKKDGTGLGLAIVSSILADHQAYVRVRDNAPRGTRFVIEFPVQRAGGGKRVAAHG